MTAPFDHFAEFSMLATEHEGTIYIEEDFRSRTADRATEASRPPPRYQHPDQQSREMMTYWGYKFETLALVPSPPDVLSREDIAKQQKSDVSNHAQHCSIVSTSFGPFKLVLGGEVDGLLAPKPSDPDAPIQWVELKTSEELPPLHHHQQQQHRDIVKFERKLLKFWAQSFLLGVPKIIVGFRSKTGILRGVQTFNTHELPGIVRRGTNCWDGNACINFAIALLSWLKEAMKKDGGGVYRMTMRKKSGVVQVQRIKDGTGDIISKDFMAWKTGTDKSDEEQAPAKEAELDIKSSPA